VEVAERLERELEVPAGRVQLGLLAQRLDRPAAERVVLGEPAGPVERRLRRPEVARAAPYVGQGQQRQHDPVAVLADVGLRDQRLEHRHRLVEPAHHAVGARDRVALVGADRLALGGVVPLHLLDRGHRLVGQAGFVLRVGEVVEHRELEVAVAARQREGGRLLVAPDGVLVGAAGAERVREADQVVGADRRVDVRVEQLDRGDGVLQHQGGVTDPAEQRGEPAVAQRQQCLLVVLLGPGLDLAHDPRAVLGVADTGLRRALDQQPVLVLHAARVDARTVDLLAGARQRGSSVVPQHLLDLLQRLGPLRSRLLLCHPVVSPTSGTRTHACASRLRS
jgi:hypothetical protein